MALGDLINRQTNQLTESAMHVTELLHTQLANSYPEIHLSRLASVIDAVRGLLAGQSLQLTAIGRHLPGTTTEKHAIKRIDRLLANVHLAGDRIYLYHWQAQQLIGNKKHPIILVDFSDVDAARTRFILCASIPLGGRALPIYSEVHESENHPAHLRSFLKTLQLVLPIGCQPVLVTDAGFRGTWRRLVSELDWYYVARQRNRDLVQLQGETKWLPCKSLYGQASATPRNLGTIHICRNSPQQTQAYVYHAPRKNRAAITKAGRKDRSKRSLKIAIGQQEPWLLLSNLPVHHNSADKVVEIYRSRMQIEELFRDLKSHRFGFSFRGNSSRSTFRIEALLTLASLALTAIWIAGLVAISKNQHWHLQANTIRNRNVLSVTTIGLRYLWRHSTLSRLELFSASKLLLNRTAHYVDL